MQIGYISQKKSEDAVLLSPTKYQIAGNYAIKSERLSIVETTLEYLTFLFWVYFGFRWLQQNIGLEDNLTNNILFLLGFFAINYIFTLPIDIYRVFYLDKSFHFTKTTPKLYIVDQIKKIVLFLVIGTPIFALLSYILSSFENWWLYSFITIFLIIILANLIYPTFIAPLFNKFKPLEDKTLQKRIEEILAKVGISSDGVFTIDASKRDSRLNAYFAGLGKSKRVVLFDTLLEKLDREEIIAVLGHELGHYSHKDIYKNIASMGVFLFIVFYLVGNIPQSLFLDLGVVPTAGVKIALITILLSLLSFLYMPIVGAISRHNEYEADKFGAEIGGRDNLIKALLKLVNENKSFPYSHPLYVFFYYSHPPIIKRLEALGYRDSGVSSDSIILDMLNRKSGEELG
jgi:STE24 endopeptidase